MVSKKAELSLSELSWAELRWASAGKHATFSAGAKNQNFARARRFAVLFYGKKSAFS